MQFLIPKIWRLPISKSNLECAPFSEVIKGNLVGYDLKSAKNDKFLLTWSK